MTSAKTTVTVLVAAVSVWALVLNATESTLSEDAKIGSAVTNYRQQMTRVTSKPYRVTWFKHQLCRPPPYGVDSPHGEHWIHVYVNAPGTNTMLTGVGTYPVGTIILKEKFFDANGAKTDFFTGMRKREVGYSPELGDWEFFTLNGAGSVVTARGKIESCMDCHRKYAATDYVSRRYITTKEDSTW